VGEVSLPCRDGATLDIPVGAGCSDNKRALYVACVPTLPGTWVPRVHGTCVHNEVAALLMRSLGPTPVADEPCRRPVLSAFKRIQRVARRYSGLRWGYLETALSYSGALRRRYIEAEGSLMAEGPVRSGDLKLKAFLKAEKRQVSGLAKPRMIFPRSPRYNLHLASWLKPFEHWLWGNLKSRAVGGTGNSRVVAKGLTPTQRANLIVRKMRTVEDCVVFEVDGKAFEAHLDVWQLQCEHKVYTSAYPGDEDLRKALAGQLHNKGRTSRGVRFSREGGRASGDFNTGMGNSIIMLAIVMGVMSQLGAKSWDTLVDGDNALLFLPGHDYQRVHEGFAAAARLVSGHEMVLERPVKCVEQVRFGQSAPLFCDGAWKMVRDWRKVLSHSASSHIHLREARHALPWLHGVAWCEASLADGVPILWAWANNLLARTVSPRGPRFHGLGDYKMLGVSFERLVGRRASPPDEASRQSFFRAWGITPDEQRNFEAQCLREPVVVTPVAALEGGDDVYGGYVG